MKEKPPETIDSILESLGSDNHYERSYAITTIRNNKITDEKVIEILKNISTNDRNKNVREHAHNTLITLGVEPPIGFGDTKETKKSNGFFGFAVLAILITAGILYYASSFAGDNETIGFLQGYAIPCLTFLALIITALIAVLSDQSKRKEEEPTQVNIDQSSPQAKAKPIKKAGKQKANKSTSAQNVEMPLMKSKYSPTKVAIISGIIGIIITTVVVILINDGINVQWKHAPRPDNSPIVEISSNTYLVEVKTESGQFYVTNPSDICPSNECAWTEGSKNSRFFEENTFNDQTCHSTSLPQKPPVDRDSEELIFRECQYGIVSETRVFISKNGDLWVWDKTIEPLGELIGIILIISLFIAPTFALIGVVLFKQFRSKDYA